MDILDLIKSRCSIRKYKNRPIPKKILEKIIEAGRWGPSIVGMQPWRVLVVTNINIIHRIGQLISLRAKKLQAGSRLILASTFKAISTSRLVVVVYNSGAFVKISQKFGKDHIKIARVSEIEATAASIQNMFLEASSLGISGAWLDTPLLFSKEINKILGQKDELIAILTFGYPAENGRRSVRKPLSEAVKYRN